MALEEAAEQRETATEYEDECGQGPDRRAHRTADHHPDPEEHGGAAHHHGPEIPVAEPSAEQASADRREADDDEYEPQRDPHAVIVRILAAVGEDIRRRAGGAIVGFAIGDVLGTPFRSLRRDAVPSPLPQRHGAGVGGRATAMARNLWSSLIANGGVLVVPDVLARHLAWFETGPSDVGAQTRLALEEARRGTPEASR